MSLWKILVGAVLAIAFLAGGVFALGATTPATHSAEASREIAAPPERIAARIRAVGAYPAWRPGVAVENLVADSDAVTYVEIAEGDRIAYRLTEPEADARFVATITDESLPFGGAWTITIEAAGEGARVHIREDGVVRDVLYRFFARYVFGYTSTMEAYLNNLAAAEESRR
jgi:hypothetical protein